MNPMTKIAAAVLMAVASMGSAAADSWGHNAQRERQLDKTLNRLRGDSAQLANFLADMPKGGDLHSHFSGAVTMEKMIQWGAADGVCVDAASYVASPPPCSGGKISLAQTQADPTLFNKVLMAWSMADFTGPLLDAHQHFFDSFGKFGAVLSDSRSDDALADILAVAGRQQQIYVELMQGFNSSTVGSASAQFFKPGDPWDEQYLLQKRDQIMANPVFSSTLNTTVAAIDKSVKDARALLGCGSAKPDPGCAVEPRFLLSANRTKDRGQVFAQWVYAFELVQASPWVLGVNLVSPEENANSLLYYNDEMLALDVLSRFNRGASGRRPVHVSLHAGELIPSVLPQTPEDQKQLTFHIRNAVDLAHAERIGHGADVLYEAAGAGVQDLFNTLRADNVLIEICLSSNQALLGMQGNNHPLNYYLYNQVPVALATDDQGVLRNDITKEYVKAVAEHQIPYPVLKDMVRASLEYSFLGGRSLWKTANQYDQPVVDCSTDSPVNPVASPACAQYLAANERAALQWKLEKQIVQFEQAFAQGAGITITLNAAPAKLNGKGSTTLSWSTSNASSCTATTSNGWSGSVPLSGSATVAQAATTTYTLTCTGNSGNKTRVVTVPVDSPAECLFDWAEKSYSGLFAPAGAATQTSSSYTYRYYKDTNSYVWVSAANNHVYYQGLDGVMQDAGNLSDWLLAAGCR